MCYDAIRLYEQMIDAGVAPEQARFVLPQGCMVNWIWTGSLAAYARFCKLRLDSHAQGEVTDLAEEISKIIQPLFPYSWKALMNNNN
jgi:thymidylate synthase (FAD)